MIRDWAEKNGVILTDEQFSQLRLYQKRLLEVNAYMNLTAITLEEEIAVKHFIDSLTLLPWLPPGARVLDIGSGAGFPGLPLKIARPDIQITLMDSLRKRVFFLREIIELLGLLGAECIHARAEEAAKKRAGCFDTVTARAVAGLDTLAGYALPFLRAGGLFLAMKGPDTAKELKEAEKTLLKKGGRVREVRATEIGMGIRHTVVVIEKG